MSSLRRHSVPVGIRSESIRISNIIDSLMHDHIHTSRMHHIHYCYLWVGSALRAMRVAKSCDIRQCRCGYQCTGYGLVHETLTVCLRMLSCGTNML